MSVWLVVLTGALASALLLAVGVLIGMALQARKSLEEDIQRAEEKDDQEALVVEEHYLDWKARQDAEALAAENEVRIRGNNPS